MVRLIAVAGNGTSNRMRVLGQMRGVCDLTVTVSEQPVVLMVGIAVVRSITLTVYAMQCVVLEFIHIVMCVLVQRKWLFTCFAQIYMILHEIE